MSINKIAMPNKPKRPMTAYMLWFVSVREKIKSDNPGLKVTEIAIKAGEIWRSMEDKTVWEAKAAEAREQYAKAIAEFNAKGDGKNTGRKYASAYSKKNYTSETEDEDSESDCSCYL